MNVTSNITCDARTATTIVLKGQPADFSSLNALFTHVYNTEKAQFAIIFPKHITSGVIGSVEENDQSTPSLKRLELNVVTILRFII